MSSAKKNDYSQKVRFSMLFIAPLYSFFAVLMYSDGQKFI